MPQIFSKFLGYFSLKSSGQNSLLMTKHLRVKIENFLGA